MPSLAVLLECDCVVQMESTIPAAMPVSRLRVTAAPVTAAISLGVFAESAVSPSGPEARGAVPPGPPPRA